MKKKVEAKKAGFQFSLIVLALCCGLLFAASSYAKGPCANDIATFCNGVKPGHGRIIQCLEANQTSLSTACQARLVKAELRMKLKMGNNSSCRSDIASFCQGVAPGHGRIINCLKQHENELTPACLKRLSRR